ncbi:MAG: toll/interleukin-1 receptor domain-containing protein [Methylococcales bacterium]|nr:toll/interleukin-1 receptor domain-containing protein [Methylococcales bacterium]
MPRKKVFISYAHKDENHRKRLIEHLKVLENQQLVDIWDDRKIGAGQHWYNEIDRQLQSCKVAVFLVSPAFLGSKFISTVEVPTLLSRHQQQGMQVVPLLIRDCTWELMPWLTAMQMRPAEAEPLSNTPRKRDQQLKQVAQEIANFCK